MRSPLLLDVPSELLTERLLLRVPKPGDGDIVYEAVAESIAALRLWPASLPWAVADPSVELSEIYCREAAIGFIKKSFLPYLAFERANGNFVASTSLHDINWKVPRFELGFWCRSSRLRQGFAKEATSALLKLAIEQLGAKRIDAHTDAENLASRALCESIGMVVEGILKNHQATPGGKLRSTCILAIVR